MFAAVTCEFREHFALVPYITTLYILSLVSWAKAMYFVSISSHPLHWGGLIKQFAERREQAMGWGRWPSGVPTHSCPNEITVIMGEGGGEENITCVCWVRVWFSEYTRDSDIIFCLFFQFFFSIMFGWVLLSLECLIALLDWWLGRLCEEILSISWRHCSIV